MNNSIKRPINLPDYASPPLNEVVIGVQFSPPQDYLQIHAGKVWELFRDKYPRVEEYPALPPNFETFGLHTHGYLPSQINFINAPLHNRFWFINPQGDELIQFQQDRLLHNWRKVDSPNNEYLRFEKLIVPFKSELCQLQEFVNSLSPQSILINQCEISYINQIPLTESEKISDWLRFIALDDIEPEHFAFGFQTVIRDTNGSPLGRLVCEATETAKIGGQRIIVLSLSFKGPPASRGIDEAIEFFTMGRELIVNRFTKLTTDLAHKRWGRKK